MHEEIVEKQRTDQITKIKKFIQKQTEQQRLKIKHIVKDLLPHHIQIQALNLWAAIEWLAGNATLTELVNLYHQVVNNTTDTQQRSFEKSAASIRGDRFDGINAFSLLGQIFASNKDGVLGSLIRFFHWAQGKVNPQQALNGEEQGLVNEAGMGNIFKRAENRKAPLNSLLRGNPYNFVTEQTSVSSILHHIKNNLTGKAKAKEAYKLLKDVEKQLLGQRIVDSDASSTAKTVEDNLKKAITIAKENHPEVFPGGGGETQNMGRKAEKISKIVNKLVEHITAQEKKVKELKLKEHKYPVYIEMQENKRKLLAFINKTNAWAEGKASVYDKDFSKQLKDMFEKVKVVADVQQFGEPEQETNTGLFKLYKPDPTIRTLAGGGLKNAEEFSGALQEAKSQKEREQAAATDKDNKVQRQEIKETLEKIKQTVADIEYDLMFQKNQAEYFEGDNILKGLPSYKRLAEQIALATQKQQFLEEQARETEKELVKIGREREPSQALEQLKSLNRNTQRLLRIAEQKNPAETMQSYQQPQNVRPSLLGGLNLPDQPATVQQMLNAMPVPAGNVGGASSLLPGGAGPLAVGPGEGRASSVPGEQPRLTGRRHSTP